MAAITASSCPICGVDWPHERKETWRTSFRKFWKKVGVKVLVKVVSVLVLAVVASPFIDFSFTI
jgi:hypothetical protein